MGIWITGGAASGCTGASVVAGETSRFPQTPSPGPLSRTGGCAAGSGASATAGRNTGAGSGAGTTGAGVASADAGSGTTGAGGAATASGATVMGCVGVSVVAGEASRSPRTPSPGPLSPTGGCAAGASAFAFLPNEISFFQIDCFGSAGDCAAVLGFSVCSAFDFFLKPISFFQIDVRSSPGSGGAFGAFFRPKEISFFQMDCSSTASSQRREGRRRAQALRGPQCPRSSQPQLAADPQGSRRARGFRSTAADATIERARPRR